MALGLLALVIGLIVSFARYHREKNPSVLQATTESSVAKKPYTYFLYSLGGFLLFFLAPYTIHLFRALLWYSYKGDPVLLLVQDAISMEPVWGIRYLTPPFSILLLQASALCLMLSGGHRWLVATAKILALLAFLIFIPALVLVPIP